MKYCIGFVIFSIQTIIFVVVITVIAKRDLFRCRVLYATLRYTACAFFFGIPRIAL
jgi:hypothetical protein